MKKYWIYILMLSCGLLSQAIPQSEFVLGADVSVLQQVEDGGGVFRENGVPGDPLEMFKNHGMNYIRLKIWHSPADGYNGLAKVLQTALRAKNLGFNILLDFHYSDTWADPGHQTKPAAWASASFEALKDSVYQYTYNVIAAMKAQNTLPDIVQLGNEIICGMLWNAGRVCDTYNTPLQWSRLADLIREGTRGIEDNLSPGETVRTMIHIANGGDNGGSRWFFDNLIAQNVNFDIIGQSYYPWWHGTLSDLSFNLNDLAIRYDKDVLVVETAYPWTLAWNDNTNNIVGTSGQLHSGYSASVNGQENFLRDLINTVRQVPYNKGLGIVYWEPDWISAPQFGSPWENLALFSFSGNLLSSISAFDTVFTAISPADPVVQTFQLHQNYPNPFNPETIIQYEIARKSHVALKIYDTTGRQIRILEDASKSAGRHEVSWDGKNEEGSAMSSGVYFYMLRVGVFQQMKKMLLVK